MKFRLSFEDAARYGAMHEIDNGSCNTINSDTEVREGYRHPLHLDVGGKSIKRLPDYGSNIWIIIERIV